MTARERKLVTVLAGVGLTFGVGVVFYSLFLKPGLDARAELDEVETAVAKKEGELKTEQAEHDRMLRLSPRLGEWRKLSLPQPKNPKDDLSRHVAWLNVDYEKYLSDLLLRSGFVPSSTSVVGRPEPRIVAKSTLPYKTVFFTVKGRGTMEALVKFLEDFHATTLLHQIRSFNVQRRDLVTGGGGRPAARGELEMTFGVEALIVNGSDQRTTLQPETMPTRPHVLAEPARNYAALSSHNLFVGTIAAPRINVPTEDKRDVLGYVRLTTVSNLNDRRWEAWFHDTGRKDGEMKLRAATGFSDFSIYDSSNSTPLVRGFVVSVDEKGLIFRSAGQFYHMNVGDNLFDALEKPLKQAPLQAIGGAVGASWAAPWGPVQISTDDE